MEDIAQQLNSLALSPTLKRLEDLLAEFNIFEAIGITHQEIRHSAFLAFLISPRASHGLADKPIKALLRAIEPDDNGLEESDFRDMEVKREWMDIDILAYSRARKLVLLIENKVFTGEHDDQLQRYFNTVSNSFSGYRIIAVYLTPEGSPPSDSRYRALSHIEICSLLERLINSTKVQAPPMVLETIRHYIRAVRTHILADEEIRKLSNTIYAEHRAAINAIIRYAPAQADIIRDWIKNLIADTDGIVHNWDARRGKQQFVSFVPDSWMAMYGKGLLWEFNPDKYVQAGVPLNFEFCIESDRVSMYLELRHCKIPYCKPEMRQLLFNIKETNKGKLPLSIAYENDAYLIWYRPEVLSQSQMMNEPIDTLLQHIEDWWQWFVETDLKVIEKLFTDGLMVPSE